MIIPSRGTSSCFPIGMGYFCGSLKFFISNGVSSKWSSMWFFKHYLLLKMWIPTKTLLCSHITTRIDFKITIILGMFLRSPPNVCSLLFTLIQYLKTLSLSTFISFDMSSIVSSNKEAMFLTSSMMSKQHLNHVRPWVIHVFKLYWACTLED